MHKTILLMLLLSSGYANAQKKHDNMIIIKGGTLKQAVNAFMDAGYNIDKYDTTLGYVYTTPLKANKTACIVIFTARVKDSSLVITGKFKSAVSFSKILFDDKQNSIDESASYYPIELRGMKGSEFMDSWNEMDRVAKIFGQPISYAKM
jgi:hypothetical protein